MPQEKQLGRVGIIYYCLSLSQAAGERKTSAWLSNANEIRAAGSGRAPAGCNWTRPGAAEWKVFARLLFASIS